MKSLPFVFTAVVLLFNLSASPTAAQGLFGTGGTTPLNPLYVSEVPDLIPGPNDLTSANTTAKNAFDIAKEVVLKALALLKRRILDSLVDQTVNWIQGGGEPMFITNWQAFFAKSVNVAGGDLLEELGAGFLCRPFGLQVQLAVLKPPRFSRVITCTLDQVVNNIVNFYEDFRQGGFIAYQELWNPRNNFYGAVLLAMDEKERREAAALYASTQEGVSGQGILGTKECVPKAGVGPDRLFPGSKVYQESGFGPSAGEKLIREEADGRELTKEERKIVRGAHAKNAQQYPGLYNCFITTPGTTVGATVADALGKHLDLFIAADDLAEYTAAIADALINRLIGEGVRGLVGVVAENLPSAKGYVDKDDLKAGPCGGLRGAALDDCQNFISLRSGNIKAVQKTYLQQINSGLLPLQAAENSLQQSIAQQRTLINALISLRDCQANRGQSLAKEQTLVELDTEQKNLNTLTQELIGVQESSIPLLNAKLQLENPPSNNAQDLTAIFSRVELLLNPAEASRLQQEKKGQRDAVKNRTGQLLPQIQQRIQTCANN